MNSLPISQQPIYSGFTASSAADDVIRGIDLTEKIVIVTGGYSGLGLETVRVLHKAGATIIVPARDRDKATKALDGMEGIEIDCMDLADPTSINAFAKRFLASGRPLHILVNSAGIMANPFEKDARDFESQFATNHLGHFQLVGRLWPALTQANGARVVCLSSRGHRFSPVVFEDIHFENREYDRWKAYGQSKTANILFALALDERGKAAGIRAFSVHPGSIVATDLGRHLSLEDLQKAGAVDADGHPVLDPSRQLKTVAQGAATSVWCATSQQLNGLGGVYCENSEVSPIVHEEEFSDWVAGKTARMEGVAWYAVDPAAAERLWEISGEMTGITFP